MRYRDTDHLHASMRAAYLENLLVSREELIKAAGASSAEDAFRLLSGKQLFKNSSPGRYEEAFEEALKGSYELVEEMTQDMGLTYIFRYPIDGHNMKVMVKSRKAAGDFSGLYKTGGTVGIGVMADELGKGHFYHVPETVGEAGLEAVSLLAETDDPQAVDIVIDRAVMAEIIRKAAEIDFALLTEYAAARVDLTNIKVALRLLRIKADVYKAARVLAEGGSFTLKELKEAYTMGYDGIAALTARLERSDGLTEAVESIKRGGSLGLFEQQAERCFGELFERASREPFGIGPVISFLYRKEREIKACRFVLTSKLFNIPSEQIAERLGYFYGD